MTIDHDQLKADVDAGTPGPWIFDNNEGYGANTIWHKCSPSGAGKAGDVIAIVTGDSAEAEANARRIARLPDLEAAYLAATARADRAEAELAALRNSGSSTTPAGNHAPGLSRGMSDGLATD